MSLQPQVGVFEQVAGGGDRRCSQQNAEQTEQRTHHDHGNGQHCRMDPNTFTNDTWYQQTVFQLLHRNVQCEDGKACGWRNAKTKDDSLE